MIPYSHQHIDDDDRKAVFDALSGNFITQGPLVDEFEQKLATYVGAQYAVAFSNGTTALHAAYVAAGLKEGDEIITSPLTFSATSNAAVILGARPVFVDIDLATVNINPAQIEKAITPRTKIIAPVDYAGNPAALDEISEIAKRHNCIVVEDAAHAFGAEYRGKKVGTQSDMTMFSFHPVKTITTGEGGVIVTNNAEWAQKLRQFRHHGIVKGKNWEYDILEIGSNYRITDFQCALGLSQLKKIDTFLEKRRALVRRYSEQLQGLPLLLPQETADVRSSWHLYAVRLSDELVPRRKEIFEKLRSAGIGVQVHYIPVYWLSAYKKMGFEKGLCPQAEKFYEAEISLPLYPDLMFEQQDMVIQTLKDILT